MPIAPLVAAWRDRWPSVTAGPLQAGANFGGVPVKGAGILSVWPNARIKVEVGFGTDRSAGDNQWNLYDLTTDVLYADHSGITIDPFGRSDESPSSQPAGCRFRLLNTTGNYTPYTPTGIYFPNVERKPPVLVSFTLTGQEADAVVLFEGFANGFVPSWDTTANLATVSVSASGVTRRLQQGKGESKSAIRRFFDYSSPRPIAYWPLEDQSGSVSAASAIDGVPPMAPETSLDSSGVKFGEGTSRVQPAYTGFEFLEVGTLPLAAFGEGGKLVGQVSPPSDTPTGWTVQFTGRTYAGGFASNTVMVRWFTPGSNFSTWEVRHRTDGAAEFVAKTAVGVETIFAETSFAPQDFYSYRITVTASGGNLTGTMTVSLANSAHIFGSTDNSTVAGTLAWPTRIEINPDNAVVPDGAITTSGNMNNDLIVGHLGVWTVGSGTPQLTQLVADPNNGILVSPWSGYVGESVTARVRRLCTQQNLPVVISGSSTTAIGFESVDTIVNLLRECEAVDHGSLYDGLGQGVGYVSRDNIYNQSAALTVNAAMGQLSLPFVPTDDDQRTRNKFTVVRKNGSSATFEDSDGPLGTATVGVYDESRALNLARDTDVLDHASWLVHLGTVEGFRYPKLNLDFNIAPSLLNDWLHLRLLNRIDITNVASVAPQHPTGTISLVAEGWAVSLSQYDFRVSINCSPYSPYVIGVLDTSGFLDNSEICLVDVDIDSTQTTIPVFCDFFTFWTHADGDYNIVIGGEEMTVTAVSVPSGDRQNLTVTRSVNGVVTSHSMGDEVHIAGSYAFVPML